LNVISFRGKSRIAVRSGGVRMRLQTTGRCAKDPNVAVIYAVLRETGPSSGSANDILEVCKITNPLAETELIPAGSIDCSPSARQFQFTVTIRSTTKSQSPVNDVCIEQTL
jgi:hypothetical protein